MSGLEWIRKTYGVPAKRGGRIKFTKYAGGQPEFGTIILSRNQYLRVRMDGRKKLRTLHPTWNVEYLPEQEAK